MWRSVPSRPISTHTFLDRLGVDVSDWPAQNDRTRWPELRSLIEAAIATRSMAQWAEIYAGTDAVRPLCSPSTRPRRHPHNQLRGLYAKVDGSLHPAPAPRFSRTRARPPATPIPPGGLTVESVLQEWSGAPVTR